MQASAVLNNILRGRLVPVMGPTHLNRSNCQDNASSSTYLKVSTICSEGFVSICTFREGQKSISFIWTPLQSQGYLPKWEWVSVHTAEYIVQNQGEQMNYFQFRYYIEGRLHKSKDSFLSGKLFSFAYRRGKVVGVLNLHSQVKWKLGDAKIQACWLVHITFLWEKGSLDLWSFHITSNQNLQPKSWQEFVSRLLTLCYLW